MVTFKGSLSSALQQMKASKQSSLPPATGGGKMTITAPLALPRSAYAQSQVIYTQPQFYSPLHTPQNWQIPQKRRECAQWYRYFYENEPKVAAGIDFYCFTPQMQVLMADGKRKAISSIKPGDLVRSHDGSSNKVIRRMKRQAKKEVVLGIKIVGMRTTLRCTPEHELLTESGNITFVQAGGLKAGDCLLTPKPFLYRKIREIKRRSYSGPLYDLEIENSHSYVVNGIACHNSSFPINGFETQCEDSAVKSYFDNLNKKLNLDHWLKMISKEYFMIGDVFPFLEIECSECRGSGVSKKGEPCNHPGGTFRRIVIMNPDSIDVQTNVLADEPVITMLPDEDLKRIVWHKRPKAIYDKLPAYIRQLILGGRPIPLANESVSHLKYNPYPYATYGTSMIRRLFKVLTYKDKLMTAQWIIAERLILPIRIVKLGSEERPAGPADIADVQQQLSQVANDPNLTLVTHHNFDYDWIGASGKVLQLTNEYDLINKEILQGLMINDALLDGSMSGYASAAIGAEALIQRLESWRIELARWMEERIYKPVAQMRGFIDKEKSEEIGEDVWIVPKVTFNDLNIRDDTQQKNLYNQLYDKGIISCQTLLEKYNLDYDHETERIRYETGVGGMGLPGAGMGGAAGGMGGLGGGMGAPGGADLGGLFGGGAPPGMPPAPGGPGAVPGAPGMPPIPGAPPPTGGPPMAGTMGKVMKRGRGKEEKVPEESQVTPQGVRLTSLEQIMFKMLEGMRLPFPAYPQYPLGPYKADFAIPVLKLDIEVDGEKWHEQPDDMAHDSLRDKTLAAYGWTVVRFGEQELKERQPEVKKTVSGMVYRCWQRAAEGVRTASQSIEGARTSLEKLIKESGTENFPVVIPAAKDIIDDGDANQGTGNPLG